MPEIIRHQHRIGYWAKGKAEKRQFVSLTNFGVKLLKHVEAPASLREESGFVVEVTQKLKGATTVRSGYVRIAYSIMSVAISRSLILLGMSH